MNELSLQKNTGNQGLEANSSQRFQRNEKDMKTDYFSERVKKLTTAVYIVTNLITPTDPLRVTIREFSIKLLSLVGLNSYNRSPEEVSNEISGLCKKIVELLEVAFFSGYISEMNFSVLKSEFDLFINEVGSFAGPQKTINIESLKVSLNENEAENQANSEMSFINSGVNAGNQKGQNIRNTSFLQTQNRAPKTVFATQNTSSNMGSKQNRIQKAQPQKSVVDAKKISRKESIISIIKMKGEVGIKDISSVVLNCSEKTIQRELLTMVSEGVLRKSGDRRWSVYSLAK